MCGPMMGSAGMSGGAWSLPWLSMVVLLVAATTAVVILLAWLMLRRPTLAPAGPGESRALAVAKERYARGEIDETELERILDTVLRTEGRADPGQR